MKELYKTNIREGIDENTIHKMLDQLIENLKTSKKVLIIPPDFTRCYSYAGLITAYLYKKLSKTIEVKVIPALGTHMEMTKKEKFEMFGDVIPDSAFLVHHWQNDTKIIGEIPSSFVYEVSNGLYNESIAVEVNHNLIDGNFDNIISVGQVVPHEVVGMANYSKNIFVGLGGRQMINKSHFVSAICGMEKALGVVDSPARKIFDYGQEHFLNAFPITFIQTVTTLTDNKLNLHGLYIGKSRKPFEKAAKLSQQINIFHVKKRANKVVTYLNPAELKTTWVGNKGIYRTRKMIEDGGSLIIIAPGVKAFGENAEIDLLTRKYGYCGTEKILEIYRNGGFKNQIMSAAHLIHGSTENRFNVYYCTKPENLRKDEIISVNYNWESYYEIIKKYDPKKLKEGWNIMNDGEEIYFVGTPALGLWLVD